MKLPALHTVANRYDPEGKYEYVHIKDGFAWVTDTLMLIKCRLPDELAFVSGRIHFDQWRIIAGLDVESFSVIEGKLYIGINSDNPVAIVINLLPLDERIEKMEELYNRTIKDPLESHCIVASDILFDALKFALDDAITIRATEKTVVVTHEYFTILIAVIQREPYGAL